MTASAEFLAQFRSVPDSLASIRAEFADFDADPGTIVPDQLRRLRGRLLRTRVATPRLCFAVLATDDNVDNDDGNNALCLVLKARHGWVDDAVIQRFCAHSTDDDDNRIDVVGLVEIGDGDDVSLHLIAFRWGAWLHAPLRADLRPVVFEERISSQEQRRLAARANGERVWSGSRNPARAAKLVRFVIARCGGMRGVRRLCAGAPILDIAGGSGSVSIELVRRRLSAHVVDPRPTSLTNKVRGSLRNYAAMQLHEFQTQLATKLLTDAENQFGALNSTGVVVCDSVEFRAHNVPFNAQFRVDFASLWDPCRLVIALHPDEPTEDIVDFCLAARKSFFVVPCCVFAKAEQNAHRRHVTTTAMFCEYLRAKAPDVIRVDELVMEGRNQVVWALFD
jgi:hypothetical protein